MGWFQSLFKRNEVISLSDPIFGELIFDRGGWTHLPKSPGEDIMVCIDAPECGPSSVQRAFFEDLRTKLPLLKELAKEYIELEADCATDVASLRVYSIEIGSDIKTQSQEFVLEMTDVEEDTIHRVTFESERPIHYTFDH